MWLILGLTCVAIDIFVAQTLVLLFFGMAALTTAITAYYNLAVDFNHQIIVFLGSTVFWSLILWRPLKKLKQKKVYSNIIGHELVLINENIAPGEKGLAKWSGTTVNILLEKDSKPASKNDRLIIQKIEGITFIVTNKETKHVT